MERCVIYFTKRDTDIINRLVEVIEKHGGQTGPLEKGYLLPWPCWFFPLFYRRTRELRFNLPEEKIDSCLKEMTTICRLYPPIPGPIWRDRELFAFTMPVLIISILIAMLIDLFRR